MDAEVCVFADEDALVAAACERLLVAAGTAIAAHGRFSVALAGGNTPRALYRMLAR
jgi:6-phosphogluconolactonase